MTNSEKIKELSWKLLMVSKLASTEDRYKFCNPFNRGHAEYIRDKVLEEAYKETT